MFKEQLLKFNGVGVWEELKSRKEGGRNDIKAVVICETAFIIKKIKENIKIRKEPFPFFGDKIKVNLDIFVLISSISAVANN